MGPGLVDWASESAESRETHKMFEIRCGGDLIGGCSE